MTSKLTLYNDALMWLGERKLASLSEAREPRRALDDAYTVTLRYCLEQGFWNFAIRSVQADSSASVVPTFGYQYAFTKPNDFVRTYQVADNETFTPQLLTFVDEPNFWYANCDPLYIRYISDDVNYGGDLSLWPASFADWVALRMAVKTCKKITGADPDDKLIRGEKRALADARSKDAMNEPPGFMPRQSWITSRQGGPIR